jgi:hypothetical protein
MDDAGDVRHGRPPRAGPASGGARVPGYGAVANEMTAEQYVQEVMEGRRHDQIVSFLLRCGRTPVVVVPDYSEDEQSAN